MRGSSPAHDGGGTVADFVEAQKPAADPFPGDILLEEFLKPLGLSQTALARALGVPPRRINEIVLGKRASPPTAICTWRAISA